jgi:hypothetical protein
MPAQIYKEARRKEKGKERKEWRWPKPPAEVPHNQMTTLIE